ncbi:MAG: hypothetical protein ACRCZD_13835 [Phycicoccus sp.]
MPLLHSVAWRVPDVGTDLLVELDDDASATPAAGVEVTLDGEPADGPTGWPVGTLPPAGDERPAEFR